MATTTNITASTSLSSSTKNDINYRFTNASGRFQMASKAKVIFNRCDFTSTVTLTKTPFLYINGGSNIEVTFNDCTFHDISVNTDEGTFILMQGTRMQVHT